MNYVVGFVFSPDRRKVLLIRKKRPNWQKGKLNGIGGHIIEDEKPVEAMCRTAKKEADIDLPEEYWKRFAFINSTEFDLHCFRTFTNQIDLAETKTDEHLVKLTLDILNPEELIYNVNWLIPLALDTTLTDSVIRYKH